MKKILMASLFLTGLSLSIVLFQFTSCTKAEAQSPTCPTPTYPIAGIWIGTYTTDQVNHAPNYLSFVIFPDGTHIRRARVNGTNEYALFKGSWSLNGSIFEYRDTTVTFSGGTIVDKGKLTYSNDGTMTNGTWMDFYGQSYTGAFQNMNRVN